MKKLKVRLTFTEPVLGTWPSNQNIAREFIASKSPDAATVEDEVAALGADAVADKGMAGKGDEQPRCGAAMRYPATAEKGEKTHGDALICSGKAEYRRAGSSKGKEKQLQCEEIHLCLFCLLI